MIGVMAAVGTYISAITMLAIKKVEGIEFSQSGWALGVALGVWIFLVGSVITAILAIIGVTIPPFTQIPIIR